MSKPTNASRTCSSSAVGLTLLVEAFCWMKAIFAVSLVLSLVSLVYMSVPLARRAGAACFAAAMGLWAWTGASRRPSAGVDGQPLPCVCEER